MEAQGLPWCLGQELRATWRGGAADTTAGPCQVSGAGGLLHEEWSHPLGYRVLGQDRPLPHAARARHRRGLTDDGERAEAQEGSADCLGRVEGNLAHFSVGFFSKQEAFRDLK